MERGAVGVGFCDGQQSPAYVTVSSGHDSSDNYVLVYGVETDDVFHCSGQGLSLYLHTVL